MKKVFPIVLCLGLFLGGNLAFAADFLGPEKGSSSDGNVILNSNETKKNLYMAGGNATANGNTKGDLVIAGGTVVIEGDVEKDLTAAGGNVSVNGEVGEDVKIGGGTILINSKIGGDLLAAGGTVTLTEKSFVGGDLVVGAGNLNISSEIAGASKLTGGSIYINSKINGSLSVRADQNLTFGPKAEVLGKISYKGPKEAVVKEGAKLSAIEYTKTNAEKRSAKNFAGLISFMLLVKFAAWLLATWLLVKYFKNPLTKIFSEVESNFWGSLLTGLGFAISWPIVSIVLLITLVGYYLGFFSLMLYALFICSTYIISAAFLGVWIGKKLYKSTVYNFGFMSALLGVLAWMILGFVPLVGWAVLAAIFLANFGSLVKIIKIGLKEINTPTNN